MFDGMGYLPVPTAFGQKLPRTQFFGPTLEDEFGFIVYISTIPYI
jgi:hypothetical protein